MAKVIESILLSEKEIADMVSALADRINSDYGDEPITVIGVLKGGSVFTTDLIRKLNMPVELDFITVRSYGSGTISSGNIEMVKDVTVDVTGRNVILVDDVADSGYTLASLKKLFAERNARSVKVCTAFDKPARRVISDLNPDYTGYVLPDKFVVGYGLDFDEKYRNLPYLAALCDEE